jgi:hypothetical protein
MAVSTIPLYLHLTAGRPLCLPHLPRRGDDPPRSLPSFTAPDNLPIPTQDDWVDYGPVLEAGAEGEWDFFFAGATPASVIKKDGTYFFYYVAADGYRSHDGDARHRSIGVATSGDGIRFTKYKGNPIMTHRPYDGEEEGANSAGLTLDEHGRFVMVYGAAAGPADLIVADARFAYSHDGFTFTDAGRALYHCDLSLYGSGDEIFPVAVLRQENRWVVYYQPNGIPGTERTLGAAWGASLESLVNSTLVLNQESGGLPVGTWGNVIELDEETLLFFNQRLWWPDTFVEVRVASPETPYHLSDAVTRYDIPNLKRGVVFLDKERRTWFLYYNDFSRFWHVKLAPFGPPDDTPPTAPASLWAQAAAHDRIDLAWEPAVDPDTGVVEYRVYRNGHLLGSTKETTWPDTGLSELVQYRYKVTAVNFHGLEGPAAEITVTTPANRSPPAIVSVLAAGNLGQVQVTFDQPVDPDTATKPAHYTISDGIAVDGARLAANDRTVLLTTTPHHPGGIYTLTVSGIAGRTQQPNVMAAATRNYAASRVPGLAGRWLAGKVERFSKSFPGQGQRALDSSGYGRDGWVQGATPDHGRPGALYFDGAGAYVQIPGDGHLQALTSDSFTFAVWVRADAVPATPHGARIFLRLGEHPAYFYGLSLTPARRIQARLFHPDESWSVAASPEIELGQWYHLAMVVDVAAGRLYLYLNGQPVPDSAQPLKGDLITLWSEAPRDDRSGAYFLGTNGPDWGGGSFYDAYYQGALADARLYNRALSVAEIQLIGQEVDSWNVKGR